MKFLSGKSGSSGAAKYLKVSTVDIPNLQGQPTFSIGSDTNHLVTMGGIAANVADWYAARATNNPDTKAISVAISGGSYDTIELNGCFSYGVTIHGSATQNLITDDMSLYFGTLDNALPVNIDVTGVASDDDVKTMCDSLYAKGYVRQQGSVSANASSSADTSLLFKGTPSQATVTFDAIPTETSTIQYESTTLTFGTESYVDAINITGCVTVEDVAAVMAQIINDGGTSLPSSIAATASGATVTLNTLAGNTNQLSSNEGITTVGFDGGAVSSWIYYGV